MDDIFQQLISKIAMERASLVEKYCEKSLADPKKRGVMVWHGWNGEFSVYLSPTVPWGTIFYTNGEEFDALRIVPPSAEGGGGT